jgi:hypothetical protein
MNNDTLNEMMDSTLSRFFTVTEQFDENMRLGKELAAYRNILEMRMLMTQFRRLLAENLKYCNLMTLEKYN